MELNSKIVKCDVLHTRYSPKLHKFRYPHMMFLFDLDELEVLEKKLKLFSHNGDRLYNFQDRDFLDEGAQPLKSRVYKLLRENNFEEIPTQILVLTNPRILGYVFNPISIYFCIRKNDEPMAVICEVCNTFFERKAYFIDTSNLQPGTLIEHEQTKNFYISPFCKPDDVLKFRIEMPSENFEVSATTFRNGEKIMEAKMKGTSIELSNENLRKCAVRYPFGTMVAIARIHYQAMLLYLKKIPFFAKEEFPEQQTDLWRPHNSLRRTNSNEIINEK
ncbi:MAG: DUF1365 domain-containing protein [Candidatus Melainabacteria bacterium]|nr:DUF1365 domain-containing protein [Candidatus Melainabacteria bacterium]